MDISHALHSMWEDAAALIGDEGWVVRVAFVAFLLLPIVSVAVMIRLRSWRAAIAFGVWAWAFGWWFLQYAIDSWTNPGGAGTFAIMLLAVAAGWTFVASEIRRHRTQTTTPSTPSHAAG